LHARRWFGAVVQIKGLKNNPAASAVFSRARWCFFAFLDKRVPSAAIIAFPSPFWRNSPALLANE